MAVSRSAGFGKRGTAPAPGFPVRVPTVETPAPKAPPGFFSRLPWFTAVISGTLIFKFNNELANATDYDGAFAPGHFSLLAMGASDRAQVIGQQEWWRLFTAPALHGSLEHLVGNLIALVVCGCLLEPMIGIGWFASIYFTGAFGGALLSMLLGPPDMLSVGASGAIMACLAALFTLSFHGHAWRPGFMRRVAGGLLFPALLPSVHGGSVTDINAHLGGMVAGIVLAFAILLSWQEEEAEPRGRSFAAVLAGAWLALTVWAFAASWQSYARYARDGFDYMRPADMPRDEAGMKANSYALVEKYPRDPRAHMFRGLYFLGQGDLSDAEPHFREALALGEKVSLMTPAFADWTKALLALTVEAEGRTDEARTIAAPLCANASLDARTVMALRRGQLCRKDGSAE